MILVINSFVFIYFFIFNLFSYQVPEPVAFFPLNVTYGTKEIKNRTAQGEPIQVNLAPGPDGKANGSYKFAGSLGSYINFPNSKDGALNVKHSITMLCWLFYDKLGEGPIFGYRGSASGTNSNKGVKLWMNKENISVIFKKQDNENTPNLLHSIMLTGKGWKFVGASYDRRSGEAKLWVDGDEVETKNIGGDHRLATQGNVIMGESLDIKITQMQVYNVALTQEQIQTIQKRTQIVG